MQVNKQQILKLLNLDKMIDQYMRQPQHYRRQATTINVNNKNNIENKKHRTNSDQSNTKLTSTLPVDASDTNKRTCSVKSINKKTLDDNVKTEDRISLAKTYSSRLSRQHKNKCIGQKEWQNSSASNYKSTRVMSTVVNQFTQNQSMLLAKFDQFKKQDNKKIDNLTAQTNIVDTIDNTYTIENNAKNDPPKKEKVRLRVPHFNNLQNKKCEQKLLKGRYQLEKLIGRGLSGQVYRARDILSERLVAIKIIDVTNVEYEFIKQLQHPNMIKYYNSFLEDGKRYIVLQYLPKSLSQVVRKRRLSQSEAKKIFKAITSGLLYLHSLSYAHRDIKLDNIVASDDLETIKFIDFGLCVDTAQSDAKEMKRFCGTTSYMAPQVISGKCIEPKKADIWSLGVALYILTVGRNPFVGRQQMEIFNKIKNNKTLFPPQMSEKLRNLLCSMLNKKPQDRPSIYEISNNQWLDQ